MNIPSRLLALSTLAALALAPAALRAADAAATDSLQKNFAAPPMEARPLVRWWWFGPSVTKPQLEKEMNTMKEGGFGGFEVQPTYPLATDGQYPGLVNLKFLSPEFLDMINFTAAKSKELGLRMDLTLGSGWPYGGPMITRQESAAAPWPSPRAKPASPRVARRRAARVPVVAAAVVVARAQLRPSRLCSAR